jgi:hypothetical protein
MICALALLAGTAVAAEPDGWGGVNPFVCELQQAGFEATGPNPDADPYCVEFDKRRQNITEGGLVEFLSLEPARVGAAAGKCFYFQSDHWRGSVVQDDGSTKTYEWDGHYFFDKARGEGGVWVTNFNVNGRTGDPSQIPGMPEEYAEHMGPGTGGFTVHNDGDVDPPCAARANSEPEKIYSAPEGSSSRGCVDARGFAGVTPALSDGQIRGRLGDPTAVRRGFLRYCATGGGALLVAQPGDRSGDLGRDPAARTLLVASTSPASSMRRMRPGSRLRRAGMRIYARIGGRRVWRRGSSLVIERRGRVRAVAVYDRRAVRTRGRLSALLARGVL